MKEPVSSYPFSPKEYPGRRPDYSYFLSEDSVHKLQTINNIPLSKAIIDFEGEKIELSLLLKRLSVRPLEDRYAIIGYGSNACPSRLIEKGIFNLPIVKVSAKNVDVVYTYEKTHYEHHKDGDAVPATIVKSSNTLAEVWVSFLDEDQLEEMDKSEGRKGRHYDLVELKDCEITLPNGRVLSPAYTYVANKKGFAFKDGKPIALVSIKAKNRKFGAMYETDMLNTIGKCTKVKIVDYFEVIPFGNLPKKFMETIYRGIIVDPTVFNDVERLRLFLRSKLSKEYSVAIASDIYFMIKEGMWEDLSALLCNWEWNAKRDKLTKWHKSPEFRALCKEAIGLIAPCAEIMEKISDEERKLLRQVSEVIEKGSPRIVKIVKEFIKTSIVKNFPILSFTRHAKRWFKACKNVMIMEIADAKNTVSKAKIDIKIRVDRAGWEGRIFLFIFSTVTGEVLETALPPPVGKIIGVTGGFVICVLTDGKKPRTKLLRAVNVNK